MMLRTTSKLACYRGRSGKPYSVAAVAATASKREKEGAKANGSNGVSASEAPKVKGNKISKAKRRAMVEDFVLKYKETNDGKLPYTSNVVKQVGGSYYVVKKILQEVEYQLKLSSANTANQKTGGRERVNEDGRLSDAGEILTSTIPVNVCAENDSQMVVTKHVEINDASGKHTEAERGSQYFSSAEKSSSEEVATVDSFSEFSAEQSSLLKRGSENVFHSNHKKLDEMEAKDNAADFIETPSSLLREDFDKEALASGDSESSAEQSSLLKRDAENALHSSWEKLDMMEAKDNNADFIETPGSVLKEKFDNVSRPCQENSENGLKEALANGDNTVSVTEENRLHVVDTKRVSEELRGKDGSTDKTEHDVETPKRKPAGDTSGWQTSEAEHPKKSTLWGTLKSFADGIINIWRK